MKTLLAIILLTLGLPVQARAHEVRPALLEIIRTADSVCRITWKTPMSGDAGLNLTPQVSDGWLNAAPERMLQTPAYRLQMWTHTDCSLTALRDQSVVIGGLNDTITDVLVRVEYGDGQTRQFAMHPGAGPQSLKPNDSEPPGAFTYFVLGVEHILTGLDHLAFVLGLILLVGFKRRLAIAVSGFTISHSLTLGATAMGLFHPWPAFIETMVALSIVFVGAEAIKARSGRATLIARWPLLASSGFGLLHGFAFAGAIAEIGLPRGEELLALFLFNLGVEVGQLAFVVLVFLIVLAIRPIRDWRSGMALRLPAYTIGIVAAYWFYERAVALFSSSL